MGKMLAESITVMVNRAVGTTNRWRDKTPHMALLRVLHTIQPCILILISWIFAATIYGLGVLLHM